ncbi:MAG: hypothetical protein HY719_09280, partial [Planctomycetes bacterium]|nr:hypothetical protein [Planctomycetota bacterium]
MPSASDKMLGRLAVDNGWITRDQLEHALAEQLADGDLSPLGDVLVSLGYVTPERAARLLEMQAYVDGRQEGKRLGTLAVANGLLTEDQVAAALDHQAAAWRDGRKAVRLGDACVALGFLSPADLPRLLKTQNRVNRSSAAAPAPPPLPGANESQARRPSAGALPPRGSAGAIRRVSSGALSPAAGASGVRRQGGPAPAPAPTRAPTSRPVSDRHAPAPAGRADRGRRSSTTGGQAGRRGARAG